MRRLIDIWDESKDYRRRYIEEEAERYGMSIADFKTMCEKEFWDHFQEVKDAVEDGYNEEEGAYEWAILTDNLYQEYQISSTTEDMLDMVVTRNLLDIDRNNLKAAEIELAFEDKLLFDPVA